MVGLPKTHNAKTYIDDGGIPIHHTPRKYKPVIQSLGLPPLCLPDDIQAARWYLFQIHRLIRQCKWTPAQWNYLRRTETLWSRRVEGRDATFKVYGTFPVQKIRDIDPDRWDTWKAWEVLIEINELLEQVK